MKWLAHVAIEFEAESEEEAEEQATIMGLSIEGAEVGWIEPFDSEAEDI